MVPNLEEMKKQMQKVVDKFQEELFRIRAGRANALMFEAIKVDYYGAPTPLTHISSVVVQDAKTVIITPYDKSIIPEVAKAIGASDLQVNPQVEADKIRIKFPDLSEERRKEITKIVGKKEEEAKVKIRHIRRDTLEEAKKAKKDGELPEDDFKKMEDQIQKYTKEYEKKIEQAAEEKRKEVLSL